MLRADAVFAIAPEEHLQMMRKLFYDALTVEEGHVAEIKHDRFRCTYQNICRGRRVRQAWLVLLVLGFCFLNSNASLSRTDAGIQKGPPFKKSLKIKNPSSQTEINQGTDRGGGIHEHRSVRGTRQTVSPGRSRSPGLVKEPLGNIVSGVHRFSYRDLVSRSEAKPGQQFVCLKADRYSIVGGDVQEDLSHEVRAILGTVIAGH